MAEIGNGGHSGLRQRGGQALLGPAGWPSTAPGAGLDEAPAGAPVGELHPQSQAQAQSPSGRRPGEAPAPAAPTLAAPAGRSPAGAGSAVQTRMLAVAFVATAVVFGATGLAVGLVVGKRAATGQGETLPTAAFTAPSNDGQLNVAALASQVDRATVDITAKGAEGEDEGTGMVLTASGIVLTNNHVINGSTQLSAQVNGEGRTYRASFLGADPGADVALVQLHGGSQFKTVTLGDSDRVDVGDQVIAVGNALALSGPETVTSGTISATGRTVTESSGDAGAQQQLTNLFQTSAPIAPGNSGGPLVDATGQVIGMTTASAGSPSDGAVSDIGFAIPINAAMEVARQIQAGRASASVVIGPNPVIGVDVESVPCAEGDQQSEQDNCSALSVPFSGFPFGGNYGYIAPATQGAVVIGTDAGSPAAKAGVAVGDVVVALGSKPVDDPAQLNALLRRHRLGQAVQVSWVDQQHGRHTAVLQLVAGPNP